MHTLFSLLFILRRLDSVHEYCSCFVCNIYQYFGLLLKINIVLFTLRVGVTIGLSVIPGVSISLTKYWDGHVGHKSNMMYFKNIVLIIVKLTYLLQISSKRKGHSNEPFPNISTVFWGYYLHKMFAAIVFDILVVFVHAKREAGVIGTDRAQYCTSPVIGLQRAVYDLSIQFYQLKVNQ